ncbi:MAG: hypothetical protein AAF281_03450 [Pseudomonadota bacterium]
MTALAASPAAGQPVGGYDVTCSDGTPRATALCTAVVSHLTDAPERGPATLIHIVTERAGDTRHKAHLAWRPDATGTPWSRGPSLEVQVQDASLTPRVLDRFAATLLAETPGPWHEARAETKDAD